MAAALRSLQKLSSLGVAAAAATTLSYSGNKPSACDQRRRFEGKTIVITGGGGTFGRVGARYFADQGAKVVLVDVTQAALDSVANDVNGITTCACDVRDAEQVQAVIDAAGPIHLLWNNAGYQGAMKPLLEYPADDVQLVMDINVVGAFQVLQACAKKVLADKDCTRIFYWHNHANSGHCTCAKDNCQSTKVHNTFAIYEALIGLL